MTYVSLEFLGFLIIALILYYVIPKRFQWLVLLIASYAFYIFNGIPQVAFIIISTLINYSAGLLMQKYRNAYRDSLEKLGDTVSREEKRDMKKRMSARVHTVQAVTVAIDLAVLIAVKYLPFIITNVNNVFIAANSGLRLPVINLLIPLGISFYTFMSIGYLVDVGKGKYDAERHIGKFALFVSFFPSIVQGPINRFDDVGIQLGQEHKLEYANLKNGAQLMMWGFFKKLVIAERVAPLVSNVISSDYAQYSGTVLFIALLAYSVQIYCDFSGGIDIATGAAEMFGIKLPKNFERPYFSQSVTEYWQRWHMTLGAWMKEYVFFPVMLSKPVTKLSKSFRTKFGPQAAKLVPSVIAPFVVFILIGIWHNASWQYLLFGVYNAVVVAGGVALSPLFKKMSSSIENYDTAFCWKLFRMVRTFFINLGAKLIAKAPTVAAIFVIIAKIFTDPDWDSIFGINKDFFKLGIDSKNMVVLMVAILVLFTVSFFQEKGVHVRESIAKQHVVFRWMIYIAFLAVILIFGIYGPAYDARAFIYQGF